MSASASAFPSRLRRSTEPSIGAPALRRALVAGARKVIARREQLNRINVFPVPDGDTGSNLAFTLAAVLDGALSRPASGAGELLRSVASDALDGARGNSGTILAQFLHGVGEAVGNARRLTRERLGHAVRTGAEQARSALAEPREGTVISVIAAFAEALQPAADGWIDWFRQALDRSRVALADTPNQLAVLRQAGVVDAGAQGFVDLLEGVDDFISLGLRDDGDIEDLPELHDPAGEHGDVCGSERWCTECVIEAIEADIPRAGLRDALMMAGAASLVIAGGVRRMRVHAHLDAPGLLFDTAARFGRVIRRKADDMHAQQRAIRHADRVAVITDSGADLPESVQCDLGIAMVPVRLNFGDEDYLDKVTMQPAEFYTRLRAGGVLPQTSQPPPGDFRRQFELLSSHHDELVYVGLSRALSGTLQAAEAVRARLSEVPLEVVDSGQASCGQGLLAITAAEAARDGLRTDAILRRIQMLKPRTWTFAAARDIAHAVRGGRIPRWVAPLARWLPVTPMARVNDSGRLSVAGALPGKREVPRRFAAWILRRLPAGRNWRVLVGHGDCAEDGQALLDALRAGLPGAEGWLVHAGPAVGAHAGAGSLVVGVQCLDDPGD